MGNEAFVNYLRRRAFSGVSPTDNVVK